MKDDKNTWTKRHSHVVDQRGYRLPPAWAPCSTRSGLQSESGRAVYVSGQKRELASRVVSMLAGAKEKVVLSSFLLADRDVEDAIANAAERRVRVYILLASEARLDIGDTDGEFEKAMYDQHRRMLNRLGGHALFRSAPHFHAKFVLADPDGGDGAGLLLTANLTKEALERNEELAVELTQEEVEEVFALARWAFWEYAEHELIDPDDRFRSVKPVGVVDHPTPSPHIRATTSESKELRADATRLIESAAKELVVTSFGWDKDHEILEFLRVRASEGLAVTVLARARASQMPALLALAESGARVFGFKWLHAKALCADGATALVMSANLQTEGLDRGFELGVRLNDDRAKEVGDRLDEWTKAARWELLASPTLGDVRGKALVWRDNRLDEMTVETKHHIDVGLVTAKSADNLDDTVPSILSPDGELSESAHEIVYEWSTRAPVLAANARQVLRPAEGDEKPTTYDPPLFDEPGGRRVVAITSERQLPEARQVVVSKKAAAIVVKD